MFGVATGAVSTSNELFGSDPDDDGVDEVDDADATDDVSVGCTLGIVISLRSSRTAADISTSPVPTTIINTVESFIWKCVATCGISHGTNAATSAPM